MTSNNNEKPIYLSVNDKACVRRSVAIGKNAAGASGYETSKCGFNALIATLFGDRMAEIKAENEGALRFAAIVGKTFEMPAAALLSNTQKEEWCVICFDAAVDDNKSIAKPCGHACLCAECVEKMRAQPCAICRALVDEFGDAGGIAQVYKSGVSLGDDDAALVEIVFTQKKKRYADRCLLVRDTDSLKAALTAFCTDSGKPVAPIAPLELAAKSPSLFWSLVAHCSSFEGSGKEKPVGDLESALQDAQCSILGVENSRGRAKRTRR